MTVSQWDAAAISLYPRVVWVKSSSTTLMIRRSER